MPAATAISLPSTLNFDLIKQKQQTAWSSGDYARVGVTLQISGESLCEAMDLRAGSTVLDVAAGNGNATLAAARRFCNIVSTDCVQSLLDQSRKRCEAEGLSVNYRPADAEQLPFNDSSFDNVISTFGVMFTPKQAQAADELLRVCRPGGKIGLASWTAGGFIGQLFRILGQYVAPPPGVSSPASWATDEFLHAHFGDAARSISNPLKQFNFRYQSPGHWLDVFGNYYGPLLKAFEALDVQAGACLREDVLALIDSLNVARDGTMVVPGNYCETVIVLH